MGGGEEESVGGRCRSWRIVCIYTDSTAAAASLMRSRGWVGGWAAAPPALPITHHVHQRRRRASGRVRTDVTVPPPPSGRRRRRRRLCEGAGSLSGPPPTLLGPRNEIASFQPFFFSFRPSWSSSTPAYGTLLPWGRTMRKLLPVSPFFFSLFSDLFSLCFSLQVQALGQGLHLSLSADLTTCGPFCFAEGRIFIFFFTEGLGLTMQCAASYVHPLL